MRWTEMKTLEVQEKGRKQQCDLHSCHRLVAGYLRTRVLEIMWQETLCSDTHHRGLEAQGDRDGGAVLEVKLLMKHVNKTFFLLILHQ